MNINEVKTCFKIADVLYTANSKKLSFNYLDKLYDNNGNIIHKSVLTENYARVYLIVVDGEIKKIGGSQAKGGIKSTLKIYKDGGINGRPSIRSFGIWYFIYHNIIQNKKVEFYMIYQENFNFKVKGFFDYHNVKEAYISYKLIEECCISDYRKQENGNFPEWNVQEQGGDWPDDIKIEHAKIISNSSVKKKISKGRKKIDIT